MITTALLVRWTNGWHDVTSAAGVAAHGRKEAALGLGASQDLNEVNTVSVRQLEIFGDPRTEIACDVFPRTDLETPFIGYSTADRIIVPDLPGRPPSNERIQAIGATMDEDGRVTYAVELRDVLLDEQERFAEALAKMANGTLGGDSRVAQPVSSVGVTSTPDCCPPSPLAPTTFQVSTQDPYGEGQSDTLFSAPYGEDYTLVSFTIITTDAWPGDGIVPKFYLWQDVPAGDGTFIVARYTLVDYDEGTYEGAVLTNALHIGSGWGIHFETVGTDFPGCTMVATFANAGGPIELTWIPNP